MPLVTHSKGNTLATANLLQTTNTRYSKIIDRSIAKSQSSAKSSAALMYEAPLGKNNLSFPTCFFGQFKLHFVQYSIYFLFICGPKINMWLKIAEKTDTISIGNFLYNIYDKLFHKFELFTHNIIVMIQLLHICSVNQTISTVGDTHVAKVNKFRSTITVG